MIRTIYTVQYPLALIATFLWIGFVCAISFMEAWLKFRAPGINLPLGLGIGRLVFKALNLVEWVMAISIIATYVVSSEFTINLRFLVFGVVFLILLVQTFYMLPQLDQRAEMHTTGQVVPKSNLHFYYVAAEAVKVIGLVIFGLQHIKSN